MKKNLICLWVFCGLVASGLAAAENYALLMFVGDYQGGIPKLEGVKHDVPTARSIAHRMGVRDENMQVLQNRELTLEGMQNAFDELDRRVTSGDKVFIYYSGHGGRQYLREPEERCAESLITVNGAGFTDVELEYRLQKLSGRAQKVIAMLDSCHSGGVTTRGMRKARFTPKYWSKGGQDACVQPSNLLTRSITRAARAMGAGGNNYVYIAASKNDEVSLDEPDKGGFATLAWAECMSGEAQDTDGSGGLTAEEIRVCAQQKIEAKTRGMDDVLPQHISIVGNPNLVMTLAHTKAEEVRDVPAPVASVAVVPVPQVPADPLPVVSAQAAPVQYGASATLRDIYNGRDDKRIVEIMPERDKLKIGYDKFSFSLRTSHAGYLYLLMAGSDGKTFDLLFPNKLDGDNHIQAGQTLQFPRPGWEVVAQGPVGRDHILAIVADAPRDISKFPAANAGPFSEVSASADSKRSVQLVTGASSVELQAQCRDTRKRNLAVKEVCSDAYGAALAEVVEE
ncbi:MAG: caspase family protein [Gallionella sp.]|nr:caspase family protein [Gallionella sp.]